MLLEIQPLLRVLDLIEGVAARDFHQLFLLFALEAAALLEDGSPSLLNEAPIFLALHDVYVDLGRLREARDAIVRAMPRLSLRVQGLRGTPYGRGFLTNVAQNAGLVAAAEAYGLVPEELQRVLDGG